MGGQMIDYCNLTDEQVSWLAAWGEKRMQRDSPLPGVRCEQIYACLPTGDVVKVMSGLVPKEVRGRMAYVYEVQNVLTGETAHMARAWLGAEPLKPMEVLAWASK